MSHGLKLVAILTWWRTENDLYKHIMHKYEQCHYKQCGSVLKLIDNEYEYDNCPVSTNQNEKWFMYRVFIAQCTSEVYWEQYWRKHLQYLSFSHVGCIGLPPKEGDAGFMQCHSSQSCVRKADVHSRNLKWKNNVKKHIISTEQDHQLVEGSSTIVVQVILLVYCVSLQSNVGWRSTKQPVS